MIRRLPPPLGWRAQNLLTAGIVARYHRGALPRAGQKPLRGLSLKQRQDIARLAAILRLANAFDASRDARIQRLQVVNANGIAGNKILLIAAQGYSSARQPGRSHRRRPPPAGNCLSPPRHGQADEGPQPQTKTDNQETETRNRKPAARSQKPAA